MKKISLFIFLFVVLSVVEGFLFTFPINAGGGQWHPINFQYQQTIYQSSYEFIVQVNDYSGGNATPVVGKDFDFIAHQDLTGAYCRMTQRTSDSNGYVKGVCGTSKYGRFVFDIKPADGSPGGSFEVYLGSTGESSSVPKSSPVASPKPSLKPSVSPSPKSSPVIKPSPSPSMTASPSALIEASSEPSLAPVVIETPVEKPSAFSRFTSKVKGYWSALTSFFKRN